MFLTTHTTTQVNKVHQNFNEMLSMFILLYLQNQSTVYLETFRCKNIFMVAINHENFIHEIIFTRVNS